MAPSCVKKVQFQKLADGNVEAFSQTWRSKQLEYSFWPGLRRLAMLVSWQTATKARPATALCADDIRLVNYDKLSMTSNVAPKCLSL